MKAGKEQRLGEVGVERTFRFVDTEPEIRRCFRLLSQLRPAYVEHELTASVLRQLHQRYRLVVLDVDGEPAVAAGFRMGECLSRGRYLYVDDLVTDAALRSKGLGSRMLEFLVEHARDRGCDSFHLDSLVERRDAHRFYLRHGLEITGHHFALRL